MRFAAHILYPDWNQKTRCESRLENSRQSRGKYRPSRKTELMAAYEGKGLSFADCRDSRSAMSAYLSLASHFKVEEITVTTANLRDGLLKEWRGARSGRRSSREQIERSAIDLGKKYHFDQEHAVHVGLLCNQLFQQLRDEHQLDERYETLLHTAALLHENRPLRRRSQPHKHAMYLIAMPSYLAWHVRINC